MPQLDFFTFPHQYLIASFCFCGLYYFNLLYFFSRIKYLYLTKLFSINSYFANQIITIGDFSIILKNLFILENTIFFSFKKKNKKLQKHFFLRWIATVSWANFTLANNNLAINLVGFGFLVLFFFFKNFLVFNAEKLMLIYFLLVITTLSIFLRQLLKTLVAQDVQKFLVVLLNIELEGEKILSFLKNFYLKLRENTILNYLELFLTKNFEFKLVQKSKW